MRYYIIAGEASGDLHASNLMKELKLKDAQAHFRCWGGDMMKLQGGSLIKHYRELAFMGFAEVIANIRTISKNLKFCKQDILDYNTDVVILIDYPGFNLRIAKFAKANHIKVVYYISPQVWAWKKSRVYKIKRTVDRMITILPFEKPFYKKFDYEVDYVGHPLLDVIEKLKKVDESEFRKNNHLDSRPIVALLPGSRKQEISRMLKPMIQLVPYFSKYQFIIAGAPGIDQSFYAKIVQSKNIKIFKHQTYELLQVAKAAMVTSGTATLETALFGVPEVVCYKADPISVFIARRLIKTKYISLVNLIMDRLVVKELIQYKLNTKNLKIEIEKLLENSPERKIMLKEFQQLKNKLGGSGASAKAAKIIYSLL